MNVALCHSYWFIFALNLSLWIITTSSIIRLRWGLDIQTTMSASNLVTLRESFWELHFSI